jgi:hypothetical protein
MRPRNYIVALLCVALLFASAVFSQRQVDALRTVDKSGDLRFLPNEKLLNHFTAGMSSVVADLLWLKCIEYVAVQNKGERNFRWLETMLNTVVQLDPNFVDVYNYGGIFLAALRADDDAALDLFHRGYIQNPDAWELPYQAAMVFLLNRRFDADSEKNAARYLALSAHTGNAPENVTRLAQQLQTDHGMVDVEEKMWRGMYESGDGPLRDLAERMLVHVELRKLCATLTEYAQRFQAEQGRPPASLSEFVRPLPEDPLGGEFFIDLHGAVQNTSVLDELKQRYARAIENALGNYQEQRGQWPPDLETLVIVDALTKIPPYPYPGKEWQYDPNTGTVQ